MGLKKPFLSFYFSPFNFKQTNIFQIFYPKKNCAVKTKILSWGPGGITFFAFLQIFSPEDNKMRHKNPKRLAGVYFLLLVNFFFSFFSPQIRGISGAEGKTWYILDHFFNLKPILLRAGNSNFFFLRGAPVCIKHPNGLICAQNKRGGKLSVYPPLFLKGFPLV